MDRRSFLKTGAALSAVTIAPRSFAAQEEGPWRTFEVVTRVEILEGTQARIWIPAPTVNTDYQKVVATSFSAPKGKVELVQDPVYGAGIVAANFSGGEKPVAEMTTRISTRGPTDDSLRPTVDPKYAARMRQFDGGFEAGDCCRISDVVRRL